jgi:hypothetical protein
MTMVSTGLNTVTQPQCDVDAAKTGVHATHTPHHNRISP